MLWDAQISQQQGISKYLRPEMYKENVFHYMASEPVLSYNS